MIKIILVVLFSFPAFAVNLNKSLRHYPEWLGVNQPTLICQCPQVNGLTIQKNCGAPLKARAEKLIPHYIYPIEKIAEKFPEYTQGHNKCSRGGKNFFGLECVQLVHSLFNEIESDLHNLTLIEPSVQNVIYNKMMRNDIPGKKLGACPLKYNDTNFEVTSLYKGWVARTYLYLDSRYHQLSLLEPGFKLELEKISQIFPPSPQECRITKKINSIQVRQNTLTENLCAQRNKQ